MEKELEYEEMFTKITFKENVEHVIRAVREVHSELSGWEIGEPIIIPVDDKNVQIQIPLKKYSAQKGRAI